MKLRHLPLRLGAGAYILSSGLDKFSADEEAAAGIHGTAVGAYPFLADVDPKTFTKALAATEVGLGAALLVPVLPRVVVATGFTAFSAALVGMYLRTPALHRGPNDPRPNPQGIGVAKDVVMAGAAASYLIDTLTSSAKKAGAKAAKKATRAVRR
ncbi:DoxX family membrane protein [Cellulomonas endometrii]|uniref:DoxX family membrane protein n=1 Tax=Cellulomonas endometrii TaxID=3036301 RepID=UPI0024AE2BC4|nr:DoxX family membrane protein [Cellulomonas endometrii]